MISLIFSSTRAASAPGARLSWMKMSSFLRKSSRHVGLRDVSGHDLGVQVVAGDGGDAVGLQPGRRGKLHHVPRLKSCLRCEDPVGDQARLGSQCGERRRAIPLLEGQAGDLRVDLRVDAQQRNRLAVRRGAGEAHRADRTHARDGRAAGRPGPGWRPRCWPIRPPTAA